VGSHQQIETPSSNHFLVSKKLKNAFSEIRLPKVFFNNSGKTNSGL